MAKKSRRKPSEDVALDMTPMIDVVFQLIIFFVVTLKQEDVLAYLDALAPSGNSSSSSTEQIESIDIVVYNKKTQPGCGIMLNKRPFASLAQFDAAFERVARNNKKSNVVIKCSRDSKHETLIQVLNSCSKYGMTNLAIMTM